MLTWEKVRQRVSEGMPIVLLIGSLLFAGWLLNAWGNSADQEKQQQVSEFCDEISYNDSQYDECYELAWETFYPDTDDDYNYDY